MHQDCAALPSTAGIYAQQNELQSGEDKPNIFHQSRENRQTIGIYLYISVIGIYLYIYIFSKKSNREYCIHAQQKLLKINV